MVGIEVTLIDGTKQFILSKNIKYVELKGDGTVFVCVVFVKQTPYGVFVKDDYNEIIKILKEN